MNLKLKGGKKNLYNYIIYIIKDEPLKKKKFHYLYLKFYANKNISDLYFVYTHKIIYEITNLIN